MLQRELDALHIEGTAAPQTTSLQRSSLLALTSPPATGAPAYSRPPHAAAPAPLLHHHHYQQQQPSIPALLRPQFQSIGAGDLCSLERRMERQERAAHRDAVIQQRAARVAAAQHGTVDAAADRKMRQAERRAKAAATTATLAMQKEYNGLCRW